MPADPTLLATCLRERKQPTKRKRARRDAAALRFRIDRRDRGYELGLELGDMAFRWRLRTEPSLSPGSRRVAYELDADPAGDALSGASPWDSGRWSPAGAGEPAQEIADGWLRLTFGGRKIRGEFSLVRMRDERRPRAWLLAAVRPRTARRSG